jgi:hypothetical protein
MAHTVPDHRPTADTGRRRRARFLTVLGAAALLVAAAGCGNDQGDTFHPVSGKVMLGDNPLTVGVVSLRPDASRGNKSLHHPHGEIDAGGNFEIVTVGKKGAPPGWYRVLIFADGNARGKDPPVHPLPPRWLVNAKYTTENSTDLFIEVVEKPAPGAYDLNVSK